MKTVPLNESELDGWTRSDQIQHDHAILDVAELDGLLTAASSSPQQIEPEQWLVAVWGGAPTNAALGVRERDDALYESGFSTYGRYRQSVLTILQ